MDEALHTILYTRASNGSNKVLGVHFGTSPSPLTAYRLFMTIDSLKATAAALWVLAMGAAGVLADVTSRPRWIVLVGCATVPPLIMLRYWKHPDEAMSESIQPRSITRSEGASSIVG